METLVRQLIADCCRGMSTRSCFATSLKADVSVDLHVSLWGLACGLLGAGDDHVLPLLGQRGEAGGPA
jgi:hypothetical protein